MTILPIDSGRYGSNEIKIIFEEESRLKYILNFESAVSKAQAEIGLIPKDASLEIENKIKSNIITLSRVKEIEKTTDHDIGAVVTAIGEVCSENTKPWVHYGLTSNDVMDTATSMQIRDSLKIIELKMVKLIVLLSEKSLMYKKLPSVGRTHGQHASIISFGLKFTVWASEMIKNLERIDQGKKRFLVCKTLGVVGTGSLMGEKALHVQQISSQILDLYPIEAATQVVPRERYTEFQFLLALIGSSLDKIAIEIRNLQRTEIGELSESFKTGQMGSSAVPVKRNPIKSERVSSLAKLLRSFVSTSFENISLWHERDLSNSANERFIIPMGVIILDEMLDTMIKVISELKINDNKIISNINQTNGQIFAEFILEDLIKKGVPRMEAYREIQRIAFESFDKQENFLNSIQNDKKLSSYFSKTDLEEIFKPDNHLAASTTIIENISTIATNLKHKYGF